MRDVVDTIFQTIFYASLMVLCFSAGAAVVAFQIYPYPVLRDAYAAGSALWDWAHMEMQKDTPKGHPHIIESPIEIKERITAHDPSRAYPGYTLVEAFSGDRFKVLMIDMAGEVLREWTFSDEELKKFTGKSLFEVDPHYLEIAGHYLYPDGDILFNYNFEGLVRLDHCSKPKWMLTGEQSHHSVFKAEDGTFWVPGREMIDDEAEGRTRAKLPYLEDTVTRVSPDGKLLEKFRILDALEDGGYYAVVLEGLGDYPEIQETDPTHLNNIKVLDEAFSSHHGFAKPGDLILSLRHTDSVVIIDPATRKATWALIGPFLRQHDPELLPDGTLSIFDNRTDEGQLNRAVNLVNEPVFGYSRIIRFNPSDQQMKWVYQGSEDAPFYTSVAGDHQYLPNGNVMVVETEAGRVFEVDPSDNSIVWQWNNILDLDTEIVHRGRINTAHRYPLDYPKFLDKSCD